MITLLAVGAVAALALYKSGLLSAGLPLVLPKAVAPVAPVAPQLTVPQLMAAVKALIEAEGQKAAEAVFINKLKGLS